MSHVQRNPNLDMQSADRNQPTDALIPSDQAWWWTGPKPEAGHAGVDEHGILRSLPQPNLKTCTRESVLAYFDNGWLLTEVLFSSLLSEQAFLKPPYHQLRHPLIFYYAHPVCLYVNKLRLANIFEEPVNPFFERIFETGVDEMSWDDMSKNEMSWPALKEVNDYRRVVYEKIKGLIETHPGLAEGHAAITQEHPLWALFLGFEHERIHIETTSVLMRELPIADLRHPKHWPAIHASARAESSPQPQVGRDFPENQWIEQSGGRVQLGKPAAWPSFGWDNEYGRDQRDVGAFQVTETMISNGEFHEFVKSGGYLDESNWSDHGWQWRTFRNAKWPSFWVSDGPQGLHQYKLRSTFEIIDMPWSWPVLVNYHEAKAYCQWRAKQTGQALRVLTEAEHVYLRDASGPALKPESETAMAQSGHDCARQSSANLQCAFGSESPVDASPKSKRGVRDLLGNLWDWCEDDFHPLPEFKIHPIYDDFSTPCFDGEHTMILGGSFASTGDEASAWARFHFRPHFFQHAGFHMAASKDGHETGHAVRLNQEDLHHDKYETEVVLAQYMTLHWGQHSDQMPYELGPQSAIDFPKRCAELLMNTAKRLDLPHERALEIGCATGRAAFELARHYQEVLGTDLSASFIRVCDALKADGEYPYPMLVEGHLFEDRVAKVDAAIDRQRVHFRRADAVSMPPELHGYDAVLMANLVCRVPSPRSVLGRMGGVKGMVKKGGLLMITSPYTWMENTTPKAVWLGGYKRDEQPVRSPEGLRSHLQDEFEFIEEHNLPLLIREHVRKFEYIVSHCTLWRRRSD